MDEITRLARPDVLAMKPYSSARTEGEQRMEVFVDANENPFAPYPGDAAAEGLNRYPEPQPAHLLDRFAELFGVDRGGLLLTRGADEAIDLLVRAFCRAEHDSILVNTPAFAMYEVAAAIQGAGVVTVPLVRSEAGRFDLDVAAALAAGRAEPVKLLFVCTPNNPTAGLARRDDVLALCDGLLGSALVVADETYVEFTGQPSLAQEIPDQPNLVVLRTLSKEYGLAGERCGITVAHPAVVGVLGRILAPYPLTQSAVRAITRAMSPEGVARARANIELLLRERVVVEDALRGSPGATRVYPSDTNFLLVETPEPRRLVEMMEAAGIKIRDRSTVPGIEGCVRISMGTPEQNRQMLDVFEKYAGSLG